MLCYTGGGRLRLELDESCESTGMRWKDAGVSRESLIECSHRRQGGRDRAGGSRGRGSSVEGGGELWRDNCVSELFFIPRCQESIYTYTGKSP